MTDPQDRRNFARVAFSGAVTLRQGEQVWLGTVADISLKGALVCLPTPCSLDGQTPIQLTLTLTDDIVIDMTVGLCHRQGDMIGVACQQIDVESMAHLRRIIELNTGDPIAAERELHRLGQPV
ncbi:PilZ domain-containing protein [Simiduia aestuariiviva]|uniref:Cyclic diguanosine monophosphate-binding protein n=1 Tax=Simiduia aestuariiviva TaxID=1510459 RepID=A0A839UH10_9GAMM|nr:hypothetical protein [Simiduia aestuariiviva]